MPCSLNRVNSESMRKLRGGHGCAKDSLRLSHQLIWQGVLSLQTYGDRDAAVSVALERRYGSGVAPMRPGNTALQHQLLQVRAGAVVGMIPLSSWSAEYAWDCMLQLNCKCITRLRSPHAPLPTPDEGVCWGHCPCNPCILLAPAAVTPQASRHVERAPGTPHP